MFSGGQIMYGLPEAVMIRQQLPKKLLYEKFELNASKKKSIDETIHKMVIVGEISPETINIAPTNEISRIFVIEVELQTTDYNPRTLEILFKLIDQKIILILKKDTKAKLSVFQGTLLEEEWDDQENVSIPIIGLDLERVWNNIVRKIGRLDNDPSKDLNEQIMQCIERQKIIEKIETLDRKMRSERQSKKKSEYYEQILQLKSKLNDFI